MKLSHVNKKSEEPFLNLKQLTISLN